MSSPKTIRWGILATGGIALTFTKDLLCDPTTRGVKHLKHTVVAAASSSSESRAKDFLKEVGAPSDAKAYGSYEELVKNPDIDIVYIATPHSHHYQNAMLCLEAGKNVLCEKAFTVNAAQARKLAEVARSKNLFLMEAVWTRYFPLSIYVREQITSGRIGPITRVISDNSMAFDPENSFPDGKHRMVNPELAGGALLDLGIYALTWVFQTMYHTQPENTRQAPKLQAFVKNYEPTGKADEHSTMILRFPRSKEQGGEAHAVATASLRVATAPGGNMDTPFVRIQGPKGEIQVFGHAFRPLSTKIIGSDGKVELKEFPIPGPGKGSGWYNGFGGSLQPEGEGQGMFWEADEAADAIINGRKEGRFLGLDESVLIMEVMDEVRKQGGLVYPEKIETLDYPTQL
ncbi:oxidoreductase domain containing protein [Stemphylium lycopersici]|uniref:D-xylose 1-dehydrogenase (NADP(+), D-xylono-1,5-lactone-forming) n=1 Tax=Stemphylium lycopersici TaxID=183478 RepID=A0A364NF42_STELY|nr:oxidoreductase domain containing protein [Stemphylium lycopersici]RAQ98916.1 oxidoreductase domain containing protein [Stemphylium lycopersici]RAR15882.1 oxidoreductase domain containing protein [Stemphylium lycopersici]